MARAFRWDAWVVCAAAAWTGVCSAQPSLPAAPAQVVELAQALPEPALSETVTAPAVEATAPAVTAVIAAPEPVAAIPADDPLFPRYAVLKLGEIVYDGPPSGLTPEVLTTIYGEEDWTATVQQGGDGDEDDGDSGSPPASGTGYGEGLGASTTHQQSRDEDKPVLDRERLSGLK